ncbi:MAG: hypothetical protein EBU90_27330 [Proteobacteria bacterium]|nr:hypothetical protein [Pseudomonadota bacterium]
MAHFAKLDENNVVLAVHVVNNDVITVDGQESEQAGIDFLTELHGHPYWKQSSYNGTFRKRHAGIGYTYSQEHDAFIPNKVHPSWVLNQETLEWDAPIPHPQDGKDYKWDEVNQVWVETIYK